MDELYELSWSMNHHKGRCPVSSLDWETSPVPGAVRKWSLSSPLHMRRHSSPFLASTQSLQAMLEKTTGWPIPKDLLGGAGMRTATAASQRERVWITHLESTKIEPAWTFLAQPLPLLPTPLSHTFFLPHQAPHFSLRQARAGAPWAFCTREHRGRTCECTFPRASHPSSLGCQTAATNNQNVILRDNASYCQSQCEVRPT